MGVGLFKLNRVRWDDLVRKLFVSVSLVSTISINIVAKGIAMDMASHMVGGEGKWEDHGVMG